VNGNDSDLGGGVRFTGKDRASQVAASCRSCQTPKLGFAHMIMSEKQRSTSTEKWRAKRSFPSINKENYEDFSSEYFKKFDHYPNQLSFLSFDLVGLIYYLILQNNSIIDDKIFTKKNLFKGEVGIFEIKNNRINHILNFYKVENKGFKKIF